MPSGTSSAGAGVPAARSARSAAWNWSRACVNRCSRRPSSPESLRARAVDASPALSRTPRASLACARSPERTAASPQASTSSCWLWPAAAAFLAYPTEASQLPLFHASSEASLQGGGESGSEAIACWTATAARSRRFASSHWRAMRTAFWRDQW